MQSLKDLFLSRCGHFAFRLLFSLAYFASHNVDNLLDLRETSEKIIVLRSNVLQLSLDGSNVACLPLPVRPLRIPVLSSSLSTKRLVSQSFSILSWQMSNEYLVFPPRKGLSS